MANRQGLREEVERRLNDTSNLIWTDSELNGYIDLVIKGLYPLFFRRNLGTTTAGEGPLQNAPNSSVRNIFRIDLKLVGSFRSKAVMGWTGAPGNATLPVSGIAGATLTWAWTSGFTPPVDDTTALTDLWPEVEEFIVLRVQLTALENMLGDRVKQDKYFAINLRQAVTEADISLLLDALHASLEARARVAVPLPEVVS